MNILDENSIKSQRQRLRSWRIPVRQIGHDIARKGLQDEEILPFLHHLRQPTFFTRDLGFYRREVYHRRYGLVCLAVMPEEVAIFVRRVLRYPTVNTRAKRMGTVVRVSHRGLALWRLHTQEKEVMLWEAQGDQRHNIYIQGGGKDAHRLARAYCEYSGHSAGKAAH